MNAVSIGSGAFILDAQQDESLLVKGIRCANILGTRLTASVGQRTVGAWRIGGLLGNHLMFPLGSATPGVMDRQPLLDYLFSRELWRGIPVPAGYRFSLAGTLQASSVIQVVYDRFDAGDQAADQPNGPEGGELDYISYGQVSASQSLAGSYELTEAESNDSFPPFPYGSPAPANHDTMIYGILGSTFAPSANDNTNDAATAYLRIVDQRRILGDKNRQGYLLYRALGNLAANAIGDGYSEIHNLSSADYGPPFLFEEPLAFSGGEELQIFQQTQSKGTGAALIPAALEIGLIMRSVRRR